MLRRAGDEAHVSNTSLARFPLRGGNGFPVGINPVNTCGERRDAERQAAVAAPEVQHALPAHERQAAPFRELLVRVRPESRRQHGDVPADVADRVRCDPAQKYVQLKPGRAGEIRTRGLLVPNRRLRPTVFGMILAPHAQTGASLLTRNRCSVTYNPVRFQRSDCSLSRYRSVRILVACGETKVDRTEQFRVGSRRERTQGVRLTRMQEARYGTEIVPQPAGSLNCPVAPETTIAGRDKRVLVRVGERSRVVVADVQCAVP